MALRTKFRPAVAGIAAAVLAAAAVAGGTARGAQNAPRPEKITIAYQFGIGYAPLLIIKQQRLLEKAYPGLKVEWKQLVGDADHRRHHQGGHPDRRDGRARCSSVGRAGQIGR